MIEKIKRNEHLDPISYVTTPEEQHRELIEKHDLSPPILNSMTELRKRVSNTHMPIGMCAEGHKYANGLGVTQNYQTSAHWFAKAAAMGNAEGYYNLSLLTKEGKGVRINVPENIRLLKLAASQDIAVDTLGMKMPKIGVVEAEHSLGLASDDGDGVPVKSPNRVISLVESK